MAKMQQVYRNSCAATSLLCALKELGVTVLPANTALTLWTNPAPVKLTPGCQKRLYQWTSNSFTRPTNDAYVDANWGYSMPTDIANCALHLGLTVQIRVYNTFTATGLKFGFAQEWDRIKNHPKYKSKWATDSNHTLAPNQRELKIIAEWQDMLGPVKNIGSLHTIMVRPGGTVMEPGGGVNCANLQDAKARCGMHGTGLSVILTRP